MAHRSAGAFASLRCGVKERDVEGQWQRSPSDTFFPDDDDEDGRLFICAMARSPAGFLLYSNMCIPLHIDSGFDDVQIVPLSVVDGDACRLCAPLLCGCHSGVD